jgi:membrane-bound lytic murein transglycosylase A
VSAALRAIALVSFAFLAACATRPVQTPPTQPPPTVKPPAPVVVPPPPPVLPPPPPNARAAGVSIATPPAALDPASASRALDAFIRSCPNLQRRGDSSQLTAGADWAQVCALAPAARGNAAAFFLANFDWVQVGDGKAFATGYYIPEIQGSRTPAPGYAVPVYRTPPDLIRCTKADGTTGRGRIDETGTCVLYFTRPEIDDGALNGKGLEIAYAADPIELFFIEIQGSGELRLPDGSVMRIGYDNQNGRDYVAIGRLLRERGILPPGGANMQAIKDWMHANPDQGRELMRENLSSIYFKQLTGPPHGSLGLPITPRATVAADPKFIPLGAPVFLQMDRPEASGMWIAQDVGGAIKGANRVDTFWGGGSDATVTAGGMAAKGQALLLLPKGVAARALAQP